MKQFRDAFAYRKGTVPRGSTRQLGRRFAHEPASSMAALLRKTGPFIANRDGYVFKNNDNHGWAITDEDARALREHYRRLVEPVSVLGIAAIRNALLQLSVAVPGAGAAGLPVAAIDFVLERAGADLRNRLLEAVVAAVPGRFGRCGGMAFSALDFYFVGWPVKSFNVQPESGELRKYIWIRLLDSLDLNALAFFDAVATLHVLPVVSKVASGALGAAVGSIGGPLGAALGAFLGGREDVLGLGGGRALLNRAKDHWDRLRRRLDAEAAWPIGFVYGASAVPVDQHQVLATGYTDLGNGTAILKVWDNNDGAASNDLVLDFRGSELVVAASSAKMQTLKCVLCEEYAFRMPPGTLRVQ